MKVNRAGWIAGAAFVACAAGLVPVTPHSGMFVAPMAQAQNIGQRTVSGAVVDGSAGPVPGATVFLKNLKTKAIRSYTASAKGRFTFAQVNMSEDYDLWAEKEGKKSAVKTVSSWDTRKELEVELRLK